MGYEIIKGHDGRDYAKFKDEFELECYCVKHRINPVYHCVDGYLNGILLDDVVTE